MKTPEPGTERHLKRHVGFLGLLATCVGLNIGGALFALTTVAAGFSGPSLPLAMILSSIPVLLAVVPYVTLTSTIPTTSATYRYAQMFSPSLALVSLFSLLVCILIGGQPLFALAFGNYLHGLVPLNPVGVGVFVLSFFYGVNLLGVRLTVRIQTVLFFILLSALILYILLGMPHVQSENFSVLFPKGTAGVLAASGLLFTFCAGGVFVIDLGGEIMEARKAFARALPMGILLALVLYVLIGMVTVGVVNWRDLEGKSLIAVAEHFLSGTAMAYFIVGGALVACATSINIIFTIISRGLLVVSQEGLLPAFLGRVNRRFGTPHWGLTLSYLVCVAALIIVPSLMFFGAMLNLGLIWCITVVVLSGMVFPGRFPHLFERSTVRISPVLLKTICVTIVILNTVIFGFFLFAIGKASFVFLGIVLASGLYAFSRRRALGAIKQRLSRSSDGVTNQIFWMENTTDHEKE